ncbi:hypothetical protein [Gemmatimonas sp.]|uniref:hypothetical protein n=1 Tax=Gemmatimonas sp. TaxID=1962908 RepID=UPI0035641113
MTKKKTQSATVTETVTPDVVETPVVETTQVVETAVIETPEADEIEESDDGVSEAEQLRLDRNAASARRRERRRATQ